MIVKSCSDQFEGDKNEEDHDSLVQGPELVLCCDEKEIEASQTCCSPETRCDHEIRISHDGDDDGHGVECEDHVAHLDTNEAEEEGGYPMGEKSMRLN